MRTKQLFKMPVTLAKSIDEVDRLLAAGNMDLTLDFAACTFVSVDGLEWLEELLLRSSSLSCEVHLVNANPVIYKVFKVARIDQILKACGGAAPSGPVC